MAFFGPMSLGGGGVPEAERAINRVGGGGITSYPGQSSLFGFTHPRADLFGGQPPSLNNLLGLPIQDVAVPPNPESITGMIARDSIGVAPPSATNPNWDPARWGTTQALPPSVMGTDPNLYGGGNPNWDPTRSGATTLGTPSVMGSDPTLYGGGNPNWDPTRSGATTLGTPTGTTPSATRVVHHNPLGPPTLMREPEIATGPGLYGPNRLLIPPVGEFTGNTGGQLNPNPWGFTNFAELFPNNRGPLPFMTGGPFGALYGGGQFFQPRGDDMNIGTPDTLNFPYLGGLTPRSVPSGPAEWRWEGDSGRWVTPTDRWLTAGADMTGLPGGGNLSWTTGPSAQGGVKYVVTPGTGWEQFQQRLKDPNQFASMLMGQGIRGPGEPATDGGSLPPGVGPTGYAAGPFGAFINAVGGFGGLAGVPGISQAFNALSTALTNEQITAKDLAGPTPVSALAQLLGLQKSSPINTVIAQNPLAKDFNAMMGTRAPLGVNIPGVEGQIPAEMTEGNQGGVGQNLLASLRDALAGNAPTTMTINPTPQQAYSLAQAMGFDVSQFDINDPADAATLQAIARGPIDTSPIGLAALSPVAQQVAQALGLDLTSPTQALLALGLAGSPGQAFNPESTTAGRSGATFGPFGPTGTTEGNIFAGRALQGYDPFAAGTPESQGDLNLHIGDFT